MIKRSNAKHLAGPSFAGSLFQLERALCHLASADIDSVGVEHVDDVTSFKDDEVVVQEQDKHTVNQVAEIVGDRSHERRLARREPRPVYFREKRKRKVFDNAAIEDADAVPIPAAARVLGGL